MKLALCSLVLLLFCLVGCNKGVDVVGKWEIDPSSIPASQKSNPVAAQMLKTMALEFKPDKTFTLSSFIGGTYVVSGNTVTLTTTKVMGMDISAKNNPRGADSNKPGIGTISADGTKMTITDMGSSKGNPVTFIRAKS